MENILTKYYHDFNWENYKNMNPYLYILGLRTKEEYIYNFLVEGRFIGRKYNEKHHKKNSIHVLMATIGNEDIFQMLECLKDEMEDIDYLTIVFDASKKNYEKVKLYCKNNIKGQINIIYEEINLGYWGHGIRNKHNKLEGDFVFHIDDDDKIEKGAFKKIREICIEKNSIYIFKIIIETGQIVWRTPQIKLNEISTQCGIIPTQYNDQSFWEYKYGGDYNFYKILSDKFNTLFIDIIIYRKKIQNKKNIKIKNNYQ